MMLGTGGNPERTHTNMGRTCKVEPKTFLLCGERANYCTSHLTEIVQLVLLVCVLIARRKVVLISFLTSSTI